MDTTEIQKELESRNVPDEFMKDAMEIVQYRMNNGRSMKEAIEFVMKWIERVR